MFDINNEIAINNEAEYPTNSEISTMRPDNMIKGNEL